MSLTPLLFMIQRRMTRFLTLGFAMLIAAIGFLKADDSSTLPVKVTFRESILTPGTFVASFRNQGDKNLLLHAEFDRADNSARKTFTLLVPANHMKEVGHNQGWNVKSGDQITIRCDGYPDMSTKMP
jgi:hypothetical protein